MEEGKVEGTTAVKRNLGILAGHAFTRTFILRTTRLAYRA